MAAELADKILNLDAQAEIHLVEPDAIVESVPHAWRH